MIDRKKFFDGVRQQPFSGKLTKANVEGMTAILDEWERRKLTDLKMLAYMLGTAKWETAHTMTPNKEGGGLAYLKSKRYYPWFGRGYVQLTWERNYKLFQARVLKQFNADIIETPDLVMRPDIAIFIMFEGMLNGEFTGKKLSDYFTKTVTDWLGARRIINGVDKKVEIAGISKQFYADLA